MPGRRLLTLAVAAAVLLAATACRRGATDDHGTHPEAAETTPPTSPPSYAIPKVIDAAYVETVMKALDHVYGEAVRIMARDRRLTDALLNHLLAIYTPREFELAQEIWLRDMAEGLEGFERFGGRSGHEGPTDDPGERTRQLAEQAWLAERQLEGLVTEATVEDHRVTEIQAVRNR